MYFWIQGDAWGIICGAENKTQVDHMQSKYLIKYTFCFSSLKGNISTLLKLRFLKSRRIIYSRVSAQVIKMSYINMKKHDSLCDHLN